MKRVRVISIFLLTLILSLAPISPFQVAFFGKENIGLKKYDVRDFVRGEEESPDDIKGYVEWTSDKFIEGTVSVEAGATLVIKGGVKVTFDRRSSLNVAGKLFVKGTQKNPVIFQKTEETNPRFAYSINIEDGGEASIMNADISGGGSYTPQMFFNPFVSTVYADSPTGAIMAWYGSRLRISGSRIHDNNLGIMASLEKGEDVKVNRTFFSYNATGDVFCSKGEDGVMADFRYNWWGKSTGPEKVLDLGDGEFQAINENIDCSYHLTEEKYQDPVLLIPGILGSQKKRWRMANGSDFAYL
ncbi:MAG: hypothetical protein WC848_03800 [Parcubacteria group bacterium]|jgi:hypothetical protein